MNDILKVGVTGGIGSGKSLICRMFSILSVPVYNADDRAKELLNQDENLKGLVLEAFGPKAYINGKLNRRYLAKEVFSDKSKTEKLNSIVHPRVRKNFELWIQQQKNVPYVIEEAALLVESGSHQQLDYLIVVSAPEELRLRRVIQRDPWRTYQEVRDIMTRQLPEKKKIRYADYVIKNDGSEVVIQQVLRVHDLLRRKTGTE